MKPVIEYDAAANAAYIRFSSETILESEEISAGIVLDYHEHGHVVGMEVLDARQHLSPKTLNEAA